MHMYQVQGLGQGVRRLGHKNCNSSMEAFEENSSPALVLEDQPYSRKVTSNYRRLVHLMGLGGIEEGPMHIGGWESLGQHLT